MYGYLLELKDQKNSSIVMSIIQPIVQGDVLNDDIVRANVALLKQLDDLGEFAVKDKIFRDFKNNPLYSKYL